MKLQYLGDYRDAFKWDFLHWVCTRSMPAFEKLVFVPLLTPDDKVPSDGQIPHSRFLARPFIHKFVGSLKNNSQGFEAVKNLGELESEYSFNVEIHAANRCINAGLARADYWQDFNPRAHPHSVIFLDPDNGFETKTCKGPKWVLHREVEWLLNAMPDTSAVIVYQHRPRRIWEALFIELADKLGHCHGAFAVYDASLAFFVLAKTKDAFARIFLPAQTYSNAHAKVSLVPLIMEDSLQALVNISLSPEWEKEIRRRCEQIDKNLVN